MAEYAKVFKIEKSYYFDNTLQERTLYLEDKEEWFPQDK